MTRRHPKVKRYRLASHVSAFQRSQFSRDKVCNSLADPVGPPGGGSRRQAMVVAAFLPRQEILYQNQRRKSLKTTRMEKFWGEIGGGLFGTPLSFGLRTEHPPAFFGRAFVSQTKLRLEHIKTTLDPIRTYAQFFRELFPRNRGINPDTS